MSIYKVLKIVLSKESDTDTAHRASKNSTRLSSAVQEFFSDLYSRFLSLSRQIILSKFF